LKGGGQRETHGAWAISSYIANASSFLPIVAE
jgi:hypothetical protein